MNIQPSPFSPNRILPVRKGCADILSDFISMVTTKPRCAGSPIMIIERNERGLQRGEEDVLTTTRQNNCTTSLPKKAVNHRREEGKITQTCKETFGVGYIDLLLAAVRLDTF